jgi:chemosensory pili system protein ChpA (sensor histidine kinase/response regulator)
MESMMESAEHGKIEAADIVDLLESQYDKMSTMIDYVLHPEQAVEVESSGVKADEVNSGGANEQAQSVQKVVRVATDIVDRLVNEAGEVRLSGAALSGNMDVMRRSLSELGENAKRLSKMLRELELQTESQMAARKAAADEQGETFDPLEFDRFSRAQELSRFLAEGMHDIIDVQSNMDRLVADQESVIVHQDQMASDIQQTLMSVRLVKFDTISDRLYKVVRQSAKEMGKKVSLDIIGGNVDVDRGVLDRMVAPLEHLLRNGVAHGIEMPEERKRLGKAEVGLIKMEVIHEGNFVRMCLTDDGQGLNVDVVRKKGIEKGLLSPTSVVGDDKLIELIFMPGFSTADTISQIAGRGVGMDVVKSEIVSLGGQIEVKTVRMKGMVYDIVLPVSLATTQAILVEASGQLWAIPAEMVEVIDSYKMENVSEIQSKGLVDVESGSYPYAYLPHLLGERSASPEHKTYNTLIMVSSGDKKIAVHVDRLLGTREIVVKSIGRQMSRISGISGATVMGDGRLGIIINPVYLANNKKDGWMSTIGESASEKVVRTSRPTVMVVDDSLTIRKATSKLLERSGYDVMVAKDGIDALEVLQDRLPDVILSDVEMPRMDGFELLKNLKAEPKYRDIPVVMITSRTADRHKQTGMSLGANVYLGKPYKEDELLGHIESFLKEKAIA